MWSEGRRPTARRGRPPFEWEKQRRSRTGSRSRDLASAPDGEHWAVQPADANLLQLESPPPGELGAQLRMTLLRAARVTASVVT